MTTERIIREWREYARRDWRRVGTMLGQQDPLAAGFFLQQSLEKYLKAYLMSRGVEVRKTHELERLVDGACEYVPELDGFRPLCERISTYYVVERYPGIVGDGPDSAQVQSDRGEARALIVALFPDEPLQ